MQLSIVTSIIVGLSCAQQVPLKSHDKAVQDIPALGFGTWNLSPKQHNASLAVTEAIKIGYRHIDCAAAYGNERDVGRGIANGLKAARLSRKQIWVTSKLWNDHHEPNQVPKALDKTLHDLGLEYLDLYLVHWPLLEYANGTNSEFFLPTWKAMGKLLGTGKVRNIGICNFSPEQLKALLDISRPDARPYTHQMELHPYLPQTAWLQYHFQEGIHVSAYSPLGNSNPIYNSPEKDGQLPALLKNDIVTQIADKRQCTPAQVVLSWGLSSGYGVIPKSAHANRIKENFAATDCELEYVDLLALKRLGDKPVRFNNPSKSWNVTLFDGLQDS